MIGEIVILRLEEWEIVRLRTYLEKTPKMGKNCISLYYDVILYIDYIIVEIIMGQQCPPETWS